jgi:hypothetical protein
MEFLAAVYSTILDNKVKSIAPPAISEAALQAGLPASSVTSLLINYSLNITAVPGMNTNIATAVQGAVSQSYADSFRYVPPCMFLTVSHKLTS